MDTSYTPVPYECRELIDEQIAKGTYGKIFYFNVAQKVDSVEGKVIRMDEIPQGGIFITVEPDFKIRIDRIITLFGKPGAAFDEYDSFANQCLSCTGGYEL